MTRNVSSHRRRQLKTYLSERNIARDLIVSGVLALVVVGFLALNAKGFSGTLQILGKAPLNLLLLGLGLVLVTYIAAASSYVALGADKKLRLRRTLAVQVTSGITNRLLPAGLGGAGLYALYLKHSGFKLSQATALVAANNILGALGNGLLVIVALLTAPKLNETVRLPSVPVATIAMIASVVILAVVLLAVHGDWLTKARVFLRDAFRSLRYALRPSKRTLISLVSNLTLSASNALILSLAVAASGADMYWPLTVVVLSLGALLGAAVPTPGGLGGVEAGILGGLIACGVPAAPALAATLIYRGLTYWLPIIPGILMLPWIRKQYLRS